MKTMAVTGIAALLVAGLAWKVQAEAIMMLIPAIQVGIALIGMGMCGYMLVSYLWAKMFRRRNG
jgi:hypothetical protein